MTELPLCFGSIEVLRPQSRAENCCDDCPHETRCRRHNAMDKLIAQDADLIDSPLVAAVRELLTDDSMEHLDAFTANLCAALDKHGLKVVVK